MFFARCPNLKHALCQRQLRGFALSGLSGLSESRTSG
jgi:hypothetical protein